jgi:serine protease Do
MRALLLIIGMASGLVVHVAAAQELNWRAAPLYETVTLSAGFMPDPREIRLEAGGSTEVGSDLAPDCKGNVNASRPDVDLDYTAGSSALYIYVRASFDSTLTVFGPDSRWYCNDDFAGRDPLVVFQNPRSGNYNIWVGTYGGSDTPSARLLISEINPFDK